MKRIDECLELNAAYQNRFQKIKEKLRENPLEPQFEFSENYIFGRYRAEIRNIPKSSFEPNTSIFDNEFLIGLTHFVPGFDKSDKWL